MKKAFVIFFLFLVNVLAVSHNANAGSPTAANIFGTIGGTTSVDQGGVIHSQARTIFSLGGGMTTFKGKKVSLLAADPPSFSAGCSGISWHFGGFSFISMDEIRQMVEAIAQASLGVAVDMAMQILCPQCYAVMSKLRDIANAMRNAAADSCRVAKNFGAMLQKEGIFPAAGRASSCSEIVAKEGRGDDIMGALSSGNLCGALSRVEENLNTYGQKVKNFLEGTPGSGDKTPSKDDLDAVGNVTYKALSALGYEDGFIKNVMLSYLGMTIIDPVPNKSCGSVFSLLSGSAADDAFVNSTIQKILGSEDSKTVTAPSGSEPPKPSHSTEGSAKLNAGDSSKGPTICHAPPLMSGIDRLANVLVCGVYPQADMALFARRYYKGDLTALNATTLGAMCSTQLETSSGSPANVASKDFVDPPLYQCQNSGAGDCLTPKMTRVSKALNETVNANQFSGLAWMIMDALYSGAMAVANNQPLPENTIRILNGSGYPLYRVINLAAVYPGLADEILQAYGSTIAVQYAMDTLERVAKIGAQPSINLKLAPGNVSTSDLNNTRSAIMNMIHANDAIKQKTLQRLSEKRALVDSIIQVNRSLQAEVISRGLAGNTDLAVSIRRQTVMGPPGP